MTEDLAIGSQPQDIGLFAPGHIHFYLTVQDEVDTLYLFAFTKDEFILSEVENLSFLSNQLQPIRRNVLA